MAEPWQLTRTFEQIGPCEWRCFAEETGVYAHGATREEAEARSAMMHRLLHARLVRNGNAALAEFERVRHLAGRAEEGR